MYFLTLFSCVLFAFVVFVDTEAASNYYGKFIGSLKSYHHALAGDVYVVDSRTLHVRNFNYDGEGPAGYFYVANTKEPGENGIKLRDDRGSTEPLRRYRKKHITLTLPEGKTINNIKWFYVWCDEFAVNFGDVKIPKNFEFPKPQKIGRLNGVHSVSSDNVVVVDAQTLLIPSFSYDGEAPDAKFWVGNGKEPTPQGIRVPDENGKEEPLRKYDRKTIVLTLPGDITIFDIGNFAIWCEAFTVDFGHVEIPKSLNVPPSLKMLGVSPQSKLNCEILYDDLAFEVRWAVAGESIVIQLVAKLEKGEYMSFGLSGQINENVMVGGDVVVAWIDHETLSGYAYDYYLDAKSQCAGGHGSCPDVKLSPNTENIRLLNAALVNGYSIVTYQRPLRAHDQFDLPIYTNGSQAVIWAIGPLNSLKEVSYHSITSKVTTLIDFGRPPQWNCPIPESDAAVSNSETNDNYESNVATYATVNEQIRTQTEPTTRTKTPDQRHTEVTARTSTRRPEATPAPVKREKPWDIPPIQCYEPDDGIFYAQMGPTGGKRGYSAITGHVGWGISWYINGLLIPEINVVRGRSYTFVVEGGLDPEIPAKYHPFYITDDPVGGYHYKTPEEKAKVRVFAGVTQNKAGEHMPTGIGRLCNWTPDQNQPPADEFVSFGAYQRTLILNCEHGEPGVVQWTPDEKTPDTVYYQCYSHRYLGWKINVHDSCDKEASASEPVTSRVRVNADASEELLPNASIQVETRVKPQNATANPNAYVSPVKETKEKSHYKDEYTDNERIILQDPYLPPPPYQKNFDYQSMQLTVVEPSRETKTSPVITERTIQRSTAPQFVLHAKEPINFHNVSTKATPQHVTVAKHKPHLRKEPYLFQKPDFPAAMHIHVVKHADTSAAETTLPKSYLARPYRHSMMLKKPHAYKMASTPYGYSLRTPHYTKLAKQNGDARASGSIPAKSVLTAPLRNAIPKLPHMHMPYIGLPAQSAKKSFYNRKREEPKFAHYTNRIVDESYQERSKDGMPVGGASGGFNPSSIVIESGFKPIIPSNDGAGALLTTAAVNTAQERVSSDDTAVEDYVDESKEPQPLLMGVPGVVSTNRSNHHDAAKNPFEGRQPELFEPMFIPSPLIEQQQRKKQKPIVVNRSKHKPSSGIAYIWPNDNEKDAFYDYYTMNAVLPAYTGKVDTAVERKGVVLDGMAAAATQTSSPSVFNKTSKGVTHTYKVTEYIIDENSNRDEIDAAEEEQEGQRKEDERVAATDETAVGISRPNINNTTEKIIPQIGDSVLVQRTNNGNGSNYKIRYIPVGYSSKNSKSDNGPEEDDKFVITIRNDEVTQTTSSDGSIK